MHYDISLIKRPAEAQQDAEFSTDRMRAPSRYCSVPKMRPTTERSPCTAVRCK